MVINSSRGQETSLQASCGDAITYEGILALREGCGDGEWHLIFIINRLTEIDLQMTTELSVHDVLFV
jgi:hypothetical protein